MNEPIVLPPLDAPFVAWLETQPSMEHNLREDLQTIRQCLRGRSHIEFISGRDAAQRVYSMANWAGFLETASFYRTECKAPVFRPGDRSESLFGAWALGQPPAPICRWSSRRAMRMASLSEDTP